MMRFSIRHVRFKWKKKRAVYYVAFTSCGVWDRRNEKR
jgi:hypothetical protein